MNLTIMDIGVLIDALEGLSELDSLNSEEEDVLRRLREAREAA